ncbi:MAG: hypothetical protein M5U14_19290 [Acidimicrobiia bacterium]|nr:hypothetical protein [Acidimicrobiia bacterium]
MPAAKARVTGPITVGPPIATATSTEYDPAGTTASAAFGLVRSLTATDPSRSTSTAGARAVWRTLTRDEPASSGETSLTNAESWGVPAGLTFATSETFAPPGTVTVWSITGTSVAGSSPSAKTWIR